MARLVGAAAPTGHVRWPAGRRAIQAGGCGGREGQELVVDVPDPLHASFEVESLFHGPAAGLGQADPQLGVGEQPGQGGGELLAVADVDEEPVLAVLDEPRDAGDAGRDHGHAHGHRLQDDVGQALAEAAQGEDVHRLEKPDRVGLEPDQADPVLATERPDQVVEAAVLVPSPAIRSSTSRPPASRRSTARISRSNPFSSESRPMAPITSRSAGMPEAALRLLAGPRPGELPGVDAVLDQDAPIRRHAAFQAAPVRGRPTR